MTLRRDWAEAAETEKSRVRSAAPKRKRPTALAVGRGKWNRGFVFKADLRR
jgi:hypothetical protein